MRLFAFDAESPKVSMKNERLSPVANSVTTSARATPPASRAYSVAVAASVRYIHFCNRKTIFIARSLIVTSQLNTNNMAALAANNNPVCYRAYIRPLRLARYKNRSGPSADTTSRGRLRGLSSIKSAIICAPASDDIVPCDPCAALT